jgi:hypothetical protein
MADRRESARILLGLGLDPDPEGHTRITKGEEILLLGGSERTHETMQEQVERIQHSLRKLGTNLQHATEAEVREAIERAGRKS